MLHISHFIISCHSSDPQQTLLMVFAPSLIKWIELKKLTDIYKFYDWGHLQPLAWDYRWFLFLMGPLRTDDRFAQLQRLNLHVSEDCTWPLGMDDASLYWAFRQFTRWKIVLHSSASVWVCEDRWFGLCTRVSVRITERKPSVLTVNYRQTEKRRETGDDQGKTEMSVASHISIRCLPQYWKVQRESGNLWIPSQLRNTVWFQPHLQVTTANWCFSSVLLGQQSTSSLSCNGLEHKFDLQMEWK